MDTPICDFVRSYAEMSPVRLHMPGHKGKSHLGMESLDLTEIPGADVLYHPNGIILKSERNAASLFGTKMTVYSTEGSSLPIRAMLYMISCYAKQQGTAPLIEAGRNAHKVFITAAALLNIQVNWIHPEIRDDLITCTFTPQYLDQFLSGCVQKPTAVYITSPDYLGNVADIKGISQVCRKHGCLLVVDNAHGAYLGFLKESRHPIHLGADLCCDSAHKTLPALTGAAYLHIAQCAPDYFSQAANDAMALFASTSPSYLILQSLDSVNQWLAEKCDSELHNAVVCWSDLKKTLQENGYRLAGQEPLKLTILTKEYGYTGEALSELLEQQNVFCEFCDEDHLVLMLPIDVDNSLIERLERLFLSIPGREPIRTAAPVIKQSYQIVSPHEALFSESEEIETVNAEGRIMASPTVNCPPAIPVVTCGERIEQWAVEAMLYYGISRIRVIK